MTSQQFLNQLINDIDIEQRSIFLTGAAGVGKTTYVKALYKKLTELGHKVALTSTTGISAMQFGGVTIHKFCGINVQTSENYINYFKHTFQFASLKKRFSKFDIIIIDEISMLRADQFVLIDKVLRTATQIDKPFGGKLIIFTGDFYQIPPVVKSWEVKKNQWIFETDIWKNANIKCYELTNIFRQQDQDFTRILNNIRVGNNDKYTKDYIKSCLEKKPDQFDTWFFATNEECDKFNDERLASIDSKEYTYVADVTAKHSKAAKEQMIKECIAKETLKLKVGALVIVLYNDTTKKQRFVNGSKGIVVSLDDKSVTVKILENDYKVKFQKHLWKKVDVYGHKKATFKQIPLLLAYALTIHKSQGMTLDSAVLDCKNIFAYGQLYVGMSRVKSPDKLTLINFDSSKIITCKEVKKYYESSSMNKIYVEDSFC